MRLFALCAGSLAALSFLSLYACGDNQKVTYVDEPIPDSEKDGGGVQPSPDSSLGILTIMPEESYSGFDGTHPFKVPVAIYDSANDLKVTASDPSAVDIVAVKLKNPIRNDGTADNGKYYMVTIKKAGSFTLTAATGGKNVKCKLEVANYEAGRWSAGEARYMAGPDGDNPPCKNCHVEGEAIDHSPAALSSVTDEKLQAVITTGISTGGFPIKINNKPGHKWTTTPTELAGLVTYLRGLDPRGFE
jgi:hypothetical protein